MKSKYYPIFIAPWEEKGNNIQVFTIVDSITLENMNKKAISQIENLCNGKKELNEIINELSSVWNSKDVLELFHYFIQEFVIVNIFDINNLSEKTRNKIEVVLPDKNTLNKLDINYNILYGKISSSKIWSCGSDISLGVARKKLISEVLEWNIWNCCDCTISAKTNELDYGYIHPEKIVSYHNSQYLKKFFKFKEFNKSQNYDWVLAKNLTKQNDVYILSDHILFSNSLNRYTDCTSSGAAAHEIKNKVKDHALFELIERDSFMIFWLNRLILPEINKKTLPENYIKRIRKIEEMGYSLVLRNIGLDICPVLFIAVQSLSGNYITCGMSAGNSISDVFNSALAEVEIALLHILNSKIGQIQILPDQVKTLVQHEELHQQQKFKKETEFFFCNSQNMSYRQFEKDFKKMGDISTELEKIGFDIIEVDASNWKTDILLPEFRFVSKFIVPGLIPLSYGYGCEPLGMDRIYEVPKKNEF